jgi:hypothetical protein
MWWLERDGYPRLDAEASHAIDRGTPNSRVGPWPYRVPVARWNEAAARQPWLMTAPILAGGMDDPGSRLVAGRSVKSQEMRSRSPSPAEHLCQGTAAVAALFAPAPRAARLSQSAGVLAACAYYVVAVATWLWSLRDGMSAGEPQAGLVLAVFALVATWITGRFEEKLVSASGILVRRPRVEARHRQPLLHLVLDAYRMGVVLQLLAFAGFVLT